MSRTVIHLDDDVLEAAAKELGTSTKRDTINTALREIVAPNRRLRALHELQDLTDEGALAVDLLLDKRNYRGGLPDERCRLPRRYVGTGSRPAASGD